MAFLSLALYCLWQLAMLSTDAGLMQRLMMRHAGQYAYDDSVYTSAALGITGYLKGTQDDILMPNASKPMFNEREMAHLSDVRTLVQYGLRLRWPLLGLLMLLTLIYFLPRYGYLSAYKGMAGKGIGGGILCFYLAAFAVIIWTALDFNGAFTLFHKVLFRNDLWLLDPDTDLMIRLMPEGLFISYAMEFLKRTLPFYICTAALSAMLLRTNVKEEKA